MSYNLFFIPPEPLTVPLNSTFTAYVINTNGLKSTPTEGINKPSNKFNKLEYIEEINKKFKLTAVHITETHDYPLSSHRSSEEWHATASAPVGGIHGTATLTHTLPSDTRSATNVAAAMIEWEGQHIWLVTAYFPNAEEGTRQTISAINSILRKLKGRRIILAGDFNATETMSSFDTGGTAPPSGSSAK